MLQNKILIYKTKKVKTPSRGTQGSAGIDFYVPDDFQETLVPPQRDLLIPSGIKMKIPKNHAFIFHDKSGVSIKTNLVVGAKVIDEDYQGEVHLHVINTGSSKVTVSPGQKIIQGILIPINCAEIQTVDSVLDLEYQPSFRGEGGFGSTGLT